MTEEKWCKDCNTNKPLSEFIHTTQKGTLVVRNECNSCLFKRYNNRAEPGHFAPDDHFDPFSQEWLGKSLHFERCCQVVVPLRTISDGESRGSKFCPDCKTYHPWDLDPGQKPLITSSRDRGL